MILHITIMILHTQKLDYTTHDHDTTQNHDTSHDYDTSQDHYEKQSYICAFLILNSNDFTTL